MNGCVLLENNVFQNHFIVMGRMIVKIQVTRLVAVSLKYVQLFIQRDHPRIILNSIFFTYFLLT